MNSDIDKALVVEENDLGYASVVELASFDMELACVCYIPVLVGDVTVAEMSMLLLLQKLYSIIVGQLGS